MDEIKVYVIRSKDRGSLRLRYTDPLTGKRYTKSAKTKVQRDADKAAGKWETEIRDGKFHSASRITWEAFRERYELEKLASLAERTSDPFSAVANHLEEMMAPQRLSQLTAGMLSQFQAKLRESGLKETTIAGQLAHLHAALSWAKTVSLIHVVPQIQMPKRAKGITFMRGRPITTEEFERMLKVVPGIKPKHSANWVHYLNGMWLSGLRLAESLLLSWDHDSPMSIDLSGRRPRLRIYAEAEKGHQDRFLPLTPDFAEWLAKTAPADRQGLVFSLPSLTTGNQLSGKRVSEAISNIGTKANVVVNKAEGKFASAHDLRRAFGTRWASKVKPAVLQQLMRHESIETTLKYYVALDADDIADELWKLHEGSSLGSTPSPAPARKKKRKS